MVSRRTARARGQHAGLTAEAIVATAIRLADEEGLPALSMRRLGAELDVEAMALYHHFPNKGALLDAIVEDLATSVPIVDLAGHGWEDGLRTYARAQLETLSAHPRLVELVMSRPAVTTGNLALMESLLTFLQADAFPPASALDIVYSLNELVLIHAVLEAGDDTAPGPHGEERWRRHLAGVSAEDFPLLAEAVEANADRAADAQFEFALDALIAGFADLRRKR